MDIEVGRTYNCDYKGITAHITRWDNEYGVWHGTVTGNTGIAEKSVWFKNGCKFITMRSDYDLKSEIREPRIFYANEFTKNKNGQEYLGRIVYEDNKICLQNDSQNSSVAGVTNAITLTTLAILSCI